MEADYESVHNLAGDILSLIDSASVDEGYNDDSDATFGGSHGDSWKNTKPAAGSLVSSIESGGHSSDSLKHNTSFHSIDSYPLSVNSQQSSCSNGSSKLLSQTDNTVFINDYERSFGTGSMSYSQTYFPSIRHLQFGSEPVDSLSHGTQGVGAIAQAELLQSKKKSKLVPCEGALQLRVDPRDMFYWRVLEHNVYSQQQIQTGDHVISSMDGQPGVIIAPVVRHALTQGGDMFGGSFDLTRALLQSFPLFGEYIVSPKTHFIPIKLGGEDLVTSLECQEVVAQLQNELIQSNAGRCANYSRSKLERAYQAFSQSASFDQALTPFSYLPDDVQMCDYSDYSSGHIDEKTPKPTRQQQPNQTASVDEFRPRFKLVQSANHKTVQTDEAMFNTDSVKVAEPDGHRKDYVNEPGFFFSFSSEDEDDDMVRDQPVGSVCIGGDDDSCDVDESLLVTRLLENVSRMVESPPSAMSVH